MKKIISLVIAACLGSLFGFSQNTLKKIILPGNKIELLVPDDFLEMTPDMIAIKYSNASDKPDWVLTDATGKLTLNYSLKSAEIDDNGIPGYTDQLLSALKAGGNNITPVDDGIFLQDGKNIGYIKFISQKEDKKIFNFLFYLSVENLLALFEFTCIKKWRKKWENKVEEMANSIKLKTELK